MKKIKEYLKFEKYLNIEKLNRIAINTSQWIGSVQSLIQHTLFFILSFSFYFIGVSFTIILLTLTTILSLEAIYISILIQMSVNIQGKKLQSVAIDLKEIQEDVEEIQEDVEEIQEDVEEIQKDDDISDDRLLSNIEITMNKLIKEVSELRKLHIRKLK